MPAVILAFLIAFMTFIFEPITMYANNINDFWFDFYTLIKPTGLFFLILFVLVLGFLGIVFLITEKLKKRKIYYYSLIIFSYGFIIFYINSNYLAGFLPSLDGELIDYSAFLPNFVSILVLIVVLVAIIFLVKKVNLEKSVKILSYIELAIFAMLSVSLLSTFLTTPVLEAKDISIEASIRDIDKLSSEKNFLILLVDAVDSAIFDKVVQSKDEYKEALKDFTYYPDTVSGYAFTRDSIPFIFSGKWNRNEKEFSEYSTEAFNNSPVFKKIVEENYERGFYDNDFTWRDEQAMEVFPNLDLIKKEVRKFTFLKQELKYLLFKFLPYPLKRFSNIQTMNFDLAQTKNFAESFDWHNTHFYEDTLEKPIKEVKEKVFQYIHIEGAHPPFDLDGELNSIDEAEGTYPQKIEAAAKIIEKYLERLKNNNVYGNSTIVLLADHGYRYEDRGRHNPILYIKDAGEVNSETVVSRKQISYEDLAEAFVKLLDGEKSEDAFSEVPEEGRVRLHVHNGFKHEEHMIEYEIKGKAYLPEAEVVSPTGREFNL